MTNCVNQDNLTLSHAGGVSSPLKIPYISIDLELTMSQSSVRYLGSRELHRELPRILEELTDSTSRLVLTIHSKPRAVMLGAEAFAALVKQVCELDKKLGQELSELTKTETGKVSVEKKRESVVERAPVKAPVKKSPKSRKKLRAKAAR